MVAFANANGNLSTGKIVSKVKKMNTHDRKMWKLGPSHCNRFLEIPKEIVNNGLFQGG